MNQAASPLLPETFPILVGINHFSGWWRPQPNKYHVLGDRDWRQDHPGRTALLGCYNDPETLDAEIAAAADHGVDFFLFLWYADTPERHPHGARLNSGLRHFLVSPENRRLQFAIEFCNHDPFGIDSDSLWDRSCREWVEAMGHPSCLRVGGKVLFKIHGLRHFIAQNEGDPARVARRIDHLRETAARAGIGDLLVGAGVTALDIPGPDQDKLLASIDFLGTYMDVPVLPAGPTDLPYSHLLDLAREAWTRQSAEGLLPYVPYLPAGWNPWPWGDPRPSFLLPDAGQWRDALLAIRSAIGSNPRLRLPDGTPTGQGIFTIYAWNEFGEGGIVAPTLGEGWMKLEAIRDCFGSRPPISSQEGC